MRNGTEGDSSFEERRGEEKRYQELRNSYNYICQEFYKKVFKEKKQNMEKDGFNGKRKLSLQLSLPLVERKKSLGRETNKSQRMGKGYLHIDLKKWKKVTRWEGFIQWKGSCKWRQRACLPLNRDIILEEGSIEERGVRTLQQKRSSWCRQEVGNQTYHSKEIITTLIRKRGEVDIREKGDQRPGTG